MKAEVAQVKDVSINYSTISETQVVPLGYKHTAIGPLPDDWLAPHLGNDELLHRVGSGITPSGGQRVYKLTGHPFVRSQNIGWGCLLLSDLAFVDDETHASFSTSEIVQGDVLLNITGASIGRCAVASAALANGNVNQHVCEIRTNPEQINPNFLCSFILSEVGQKQIDSFQAGGNRQGLNFNQIRSFMIPLPPITEQRAIAEALSDVDGLLEALEALIAKKRAIKRAAMQQLLTGKTRLPGFSGEWETKRLGEIALFFKGSGLSKMDLMRDGKSRCIHYGELFTTYGERITEVLNGTDQDGLFFRSTSNDVLMPTSDVTPNGLATASCILLSGIILGGDILIIRASVQNLKGEFLAYAVRVYRNQVMQLVSGTTVFHLYGRDMANFHFPVPNVDEQTAIASVLSDMDTEIEALEHRRDKTRAIKQGMMQQLLTGRVRLAKLQKIADA